MQSFTLKHRACGHEFKVEREVAERVRVDLNGGRPRLVRDYALDEKGEPTGKFEEREVLDNAPVKCPGCGKEGDHAAFMSLILDDSSGRLSALASDRDVEIAEYAKAGLLKAR